MLPPLRRGVNEVGKQAYVIYAEKKLRVTAAPGNKRRNWGRRGPLIFTRETKVRDRMKRGTTALSMNFEYCMPDVMHAGRTNGTEHFAGQPYMAFAARLHMPDSGNGPI